MQLAIVTGGGSGIGAALVTRLATAEPNLMVVAIGRTNSKLDAMRLSMPEEERRRILTVQADISTAEGVASIVSSIPASPIKYLVHNAGLLGPISPLADIDRTTWDAIVATNLSAPLFLTQALLPQLKQCVDMDAKKARVLHISSGAAKSAYCGWGPYCISKSGLNMMYRCLALELSRENILVGSLRPGVVDTDMQLPIREFAGPEDTFPMKSKFISLHKDGKLESPKNVAWFCHYLLSSVDEEEFIADEFDIRNEKANEKWLRYQSEG
ncbi:hypothetical protein THAOC_34926 [Thalassiosira oceanica]|uniref:Sepiapterin reductase n=1 Tax=Thalassiosira oceanica TaxID=159749 RepID=K0R1Q0_THAOC|nr:hypothetical protein THAOC_34926 [Thalassiosira oceanica]|eukprot:EJK46403.1 hypothetical protein THAOC_34926 [Thalassiosira oceanica]